MAKMTLKVKVNDLQFQCQPRVSDDACLVQIWWFYPKSVTSQSSCGQAEFPRIVSQNGQNDLEGQGQWPPFSIPDEIIPGCMFGANLVTLLAQTCDELTCGQGKVYGRTDGQIDGQTQAMTIPIRPERPRGKNEKLFYSNHIHTSNFMHGYTGHSLFKGLLPTMISFTGLKYASKRITMSNAVCNVILLQK